MPQQKLTLTDIVKIAIIGPESTGKSTLVQLLATHFNAPFVPEFARTYLKKKHPPNYDFADLEAIARGQISAMAEAEKRAEKRVFFDTDLITLHIWALDKFGKPIPFVEANLKKLKANFYLVCKPDIPWQPDPLREDATRRDLLFEWNMHVLEGLDANSAVISGMGDARLKSAITAVSKFLKEREG
jgi:NadR type nicotinamide-nucleotide adenylyltransferase